MSCRVPFGPFTLMVWPATLAVTPDGIATGLLPMRDIARTPALEHRTDDFAADVLVAGIVIGHHALGRGHDRDAETVVDARQRLDRGIDAAPRLRHPGNLANDRRAVEILELDVELGAAVLVLDRRVAADIAVALEHVEHARAQRRPRRRHLGLVARGGVADTGDQVADGIIERHIAYPSSPARLHQTRDQALGTEIPQRDAAHLELAVIGARPPRHGAAVADAGARGVARQLGELERRRETVLHRQRLVARDGLEPRAPSREFLGQLAPSLVLFDRTLLRHSLVSCPLRV